MDPVNNSRGVRPGAEHYRNLSLRFREIVFRDTITKDKHSGT